MEKGPDQTWMKKWCRQGGGEEQARALRRVMVTRAVLMPWMRYRVSDGYRAGWMEEVATAAQNASLMISSSDEQHQIMRSSASGRSSSVLSQSMDSLQSIGTGVSSQSMDSLQSIGTGVSSQSMDSLQSIGTGVSSQSMASLQSIGTMSHFMIESRRLE
jgi:hypothetical protein